MNVNISEVNAWVVLALAIIGWISAVAVKFNDVAQLKKALLTLAAEHNAALAALESEQKSQRELYESKLREQEAVFHARQNAFESKVEAIHTSEKNAVNSKLDHIISELGNLKVGLAEVKTTVNERTGRVA